jgi:hypothetical protein
MKPIRDAWCDVIYERLNSFKGNVMSAEEKMWRDRAYDHLKSSSSKGNLDKELIPYLDRINAFPFIATTQSCCGHGGSKERRAYIEFRSGMSMEDTVAKLIEPLYHELDDEIWLALSCDTLGYVFWVKNERWKDTLEIFIDLLERV